MFVDIINLCYIGQSDKMCLEWTAGKSYVGKLNLHCVRLAMSKIE